MQGEESGERKRVMQLGRPRSTQREREREERERVIDAEEEGAM